MDEGYLNTYEGLLETVRISKQLLNMQVIGVGSNIATPDHKLDLTTVLCACSKI